LNDEHQQALSIGVRPFGSKSVALVIAVVAISACSAVPLGSTLPSSDVVSSPSPTEPPPTATTQATPPATVVPVLPDDLVAALEQGGIHAAQPDGSIPVSSSDIAAAIAVARATYGSAGSAVAYPATVTVEGYHTGDENSPLVIENRELIVVQITGLDMSPIGGRYGDPPPGPEDKNHELIVLIDAKTGEYLMASSTR